MYEEIDFLISSYWHSKNLNYSSACMKKFNDQFRNRQMKDLRSKQNKNINDYHLRRKPLKINFQKSFLILGKIFYYFIGNTE